MSWLTPTLVASICTAIATVLGSIQAATYRSKTRLRQLSAQVDAMEEYTWNIRHIVHRYNANLPENVEPVKMPDLPEFLKDTVDGGGG